MQHCLNISMLAKYSSILFVLLLPTHLFAEECDPVAKLISLEGAVETKRADEETWHSATLDQLLCTGDVLRTGDDSRAGVRLINETLLRLDGDSALTFTHIEKKSRSLLDLLRGAVHFISRTPKSLEVRTPYVNASIEGTEFVVQIGEDATDVTVFEGVVITSNASGSIELAANQTAHTVSNQAPVRITKATPLDAVTWALYYPPLPEQPEAADTLAQQSITAIAQNRLIEAAELAKQALAEDSQSAAAYMAQSYVDQAQFNIPAALANSQMAAELAPQSALTLARLAEVWLMTGDTRAAQQTANQAVSLDPKLSLSHTILGFASLRDVNLDAAMAAFEEAINLDSAAPLPRLGLGLAKIRQGALQTGREEIEAAALLDPGNALLRSYMGKAYYEEKRNGLASEQFALAKAFDPNDPTAWFYDSILLQSDNRPVEALQAQQQAIELNDNRGVYRSRQLLDQDEASRSVVLGRIYRDLGFEQLVIDEGANSLHKDPKNFTAHRLLSDAYAAIPRYEIARSSELLQAQMLQPGNLLPIQPQLSETSLTALENTGPTDISYNEYSPLFTRNRVALQASALVAGNDTLGDEVIISGLHDRFSFSLGQYHYETDGFRVNSDIDYDLYNLFGQYALTPDITIQAEYKYLDTEFGDLELRFDPDVFFPGDRNEWTRNSARVGLTYQYSPESTFITNISHIDSDELQSREVQSIDPIGIISDFNSSQRKDKNGYSFEAQFIHQSVDDWSVIAGINHTQQEVTEENRSSTHNTFPTRESYPPFYPYPPGFTFPIGIPLLFEESSNSIDSETELDNGYLYTYWNPTAEIKTTFAVSYDDYDDGLISRDRFNPKLGLTWSLPSSTTIRTAYFETISRLVGLRQTIEPTHINGFNQLFNDPNGSKVKNYGVALEQQFSSNLYAGAELFFRDLDLFTIDQFARTTTPAEQDEKIYRGYLFWTPLSTLSISSEYFYESINRDTSIDGIDVKTHRFPFQLNYYHPTGYFAKFMPTFVKQKIVSDSQGNGEDNFIVTDLELGYRFSNKHGSVRIGANNIFNEEFRYRDSLFNSNNPEIPQFQPERVLFLQLTLAY